MTYHEAVALYGCPRALSIAIGVDPSTVARWKGRKRIPNEHALELLLMLAPGAYAAQRDAIHRKAMHRHRAAIRYLRARRPELLPHVPMAQLAPVPDEPGEE